MKRMWLVDGLSVALILILNTALAWAEKLKEITGKDGAPMVLVLDGEFLYGDDKQRKSLSAFYMDKYEVTTRLYADFVAATGRKGPEFWEAKVPIKHPQKPVVGVTWFDAEAYCRHYGKRLPTEHEWEKAARGTDGRKYPWGDEKPTTRHALFGLFETEWKGYGTLATVESYEEGKSPYGLYNMAGNVWEWTSSGDDSDKVIRGGSWYDAAFNVRSTSRGMWSPTFLWYDIGFRCAQDAS